MDRRIGQFSVSMKIVRDDIPSAMAALEGCVVIRAEYMLMTDNIDYTAIHSDFDSVPEGTVAPKYSAVISGGKRRWERK